MKIIQVDNFDRDNVPDVLICENIKSEIYGNAIVDALNEKYSGESSEFWAILVSDSRKLITLEDIYG